MSRGWREDCPSYRMQESGPRPRHGLRGTRHMGRPGRRAGGWLGPPGPGPGGGGAGWQPLCKHPPALQDICWLPALGTTLILTYYAFGCALMWMLIYCSFYKNFSENQRYRKILKLSKLYTRGEGGQITSCVTLLLPSFF